MGRRIDREREKIRPGARESLLLKALCMSHPWATAGEGLHK